MMKVTRAKADDNIYIRCENGKVARLPFELSTGKKINKIMDAVRLYEKLKKEINRVYIQEHPNGNGYLVKVVEQYETLQEAQKFRKIARFIFEGENHV